MRAREMTMVTNSAPTTTPTSHCCPPSEWPEPGSDPELPPVELSTSQYPCDDAHLVESWSAAWSCPTPSRLLVWVACPHTPGSVSTHSDTL